MEHETQEKKSRAVSGEEPTLVKLVAGRRDNATADAAGGIGIFPLDLSELLQDTAESG